MQRRKEANDAENVDKNVDLDAQNRANNDVESQGEKANGGSRILGSGTRRNGMESGTLTMKAPDSRLEIQ